ncbi:MAG: phenylalanine--tRNA ligase subunit beta [Anaerolineae bacterium]|nr:phenylalanine--tRNA ligase subunit beta [Anaerolineae bacterium]
MLVPLSWLKEYVDITVPLDELCERLTLAGLEVAAVDRIGLPGAELAWDREAIVVGEIVAVEPHPNADRLVLAEVDYGGPELETVVTGAPNLFPYKGQRGLHLKVIFAMEGAELYDGHTEGRKRMRLRRTQIRGVSSRAMVCSEKELGLGPDHTGIIVLPDDAPAPGMPLVDYLGDVVLDLDLTPNLARCFSMVGVAREVSALTGAPLRLPDTSMVAPGAPVDEQVEIVIEDPDLCHRYSATIIRGVEIGPSPSWMQRRLTLAGMRPISNIVDITNYVMLELGQPLHAFDYDLLLARAQQTGRQTPAIIMRRAHEGERMETLDGVERELTPDMLMITDSGGPIAVGGVMGGVETEIHAGTRNILLESASFDFISNRRTAQALKIPSEATARFGRGVPASGTVAAAQRASELMRAIAGGTIARGVADVYPVVQPVVVVDLAVSEVERILGVAVPHEDVIAILEGLAFEVQDAGQILRVTVPQHRLDVTIAADLIEEIARVYGYDRIPTTLIDDALPPQRSNRALELEERTRDLLVGVGLQETITYPLGNLESFGKLTPGAPPPDPAAYVRLANYLTSEREFMRRTLMTSALETVRDNLRFSDRIAIFEIGRVYWPREDHDLPDEPRHLSIAMTGPRVPRSWLDAQAEPFGFFDLKGAIEALLVGLNVRDARFAPTQHPTFQTGRVAALSLGETEVGVLGEVHPQVREAFGLGEQRVCLAEFNLELLLERAGAPVQMASLSTYPAVYEDLAIVVERDVHADVVGELIAQTGGPMLRAVSLFDVYEGAQVGPGKKSLAYALTYQADDRTLKAEDVARIRDKIIGRLERELGAQLRS